MSRRHSILYRIVDRVEYGEKRDVPEMVSNNLEAVGMSNV